MSDAIQQVIRGEFDKALANMQALSADDALHLQLEQAVALCIDSLRNGRKLLFCGNGGSAADAQHWAGELVSRFYYDRPGLAAIALTTDSSLPPLRPVNAITCMPRTRATSAARSTFGELPDVEIATSTSPAWPSASTWRANTKS